MRNGSDPHMGAYENRGPLKIDPQVVRSPDFLDPEKVPRISETPTFVFGGSQVGFLAKDAFKNHISLEL